MLMVRRLLHTVIDLWHAWREEKDPSASFRRLAGWQQFRIGVLQFVVVLLFFGLNTGFWVEQIVQHEYFEELSQKIPADLESWLALSGEITSERPTVESPVGSRRESLGGMMWRAKVAMARLLIDGPRAFLFRTLALVATSQITFWWVLASYRMREAVYVRIPVMVAAYHAVLTGAGAVVVNATAARGRLEILISVVLFATVGLGIRKLNANAPAFVRLTPGGDRFFPPDDRLLQRSAGVCTALLGLIVGTLRWL